jgi:hypothetical protein
MFLQASKKWTRRFSAKSHADHEVITEYGEEHRPPFEILRDGTGKQQVERKKLTLPPNPQPACSATRQTGHMAVQLKYS